MNQRDLDNLNFLLTSSKEVLIDWYDSVGEDCHAYAQELLEIASIEILDQHRATELTNSILQKFRLNK